MKQNKFWQTFFNYWYVFVLYLLAGSLLIPLLRYYVDAIDMLNYITISEKYLNGNIYDAVNDYWSPLLPWLLTPFLFFKIDSFLAFHILQLLIGLVTIKICIEFIKPIKIKVWMKGVFHFSFIPLILAYGQLYGTPDLLFLTLLLYYIKYLTDENYLTHSSYGSISGMFGGFLFLAKAFAFPFFLVHFPAINCIYWLRNKNSHSKKIISRNLITGLAIFLLISSAWITCLSFKNKEVTISGSGKYNFALVGPEYNQHHPVYQEGLYKPTNSTSVNITETLSAIQMNSWNPFASKYNFNYWLSIIKNNFKSIYYFDFSHQIGIILIVTLLTFIIAQNKLKSLSIQALTIIITWLIYDAGYLFIIVNHRYIWINTLIIILLFSYLLEKLCYKNKVQSLLSSFLFISFIFLLVKRPLKEVLFLKDKDSSFSELVNAIAHPINTIEYSNQVNKNLFAISDKFKTQAKLRGRVANQQQLLTENYLSTAIICYYSGSTHYGELTEAIIKQEGFTQLHNFNIDFYYSWKELNNDLTFVLPAIYTDHISGLHIYKLLKK